MSYYLQFYHQNKRIIMIKSNESDAQFLQVQINFPLIFIPNKHYNINIIRILESDEFNISRNIDDSFISDSNKYILDIYLNNNNEPEIKLLNFKDQKECFETFEELKLFINSIL